MQKLVVTKVTPTEKGNFSFILKAQEESVKAGRFSSQGRRVSFQLFQEDEVLSLNEEFLFETRRGEDNRIAEVDLTEPESGEVVTFTVDYVPYTLPNGKDILIKQMFLKVPEEVAA